ncbi:MAG: hypothetical protein LBH51_06450, partial [Treponema sp.]|nr:hypothetical protein [Treponema sp.]
QGEEGAGRAGIEGVFSFLRVPGEPQFALVGLCGLNSYCRLFLLSGDFRGVCVSAFHAKSHGAEDSVSAAGKEAKPKGCAFWFCGVSLCETPVLPLL